MTIEIQHLASGELQGPRPTGVEPHIATNIPGKAYSLVHILNGQGNKSCVRPVTGPETERQTNNEEARAETTRRGAQFH